MRGTIWWSGGWAIAAYVRHSVYRPPLLRPALLQSPMSTTSLPSYAAPDLSRIPSYTAEPQAYEQRLALNILRARPSGEFTKQSKGGGISLRLFDQEEKAAVPTYGHGTPICGIVEVVRPEGVHAVEIKVRFLRLSASR